MSFNVQILKILLHYPIVCQNCLFALYYMPICIVLHAKAYCLVSREFQELALADSGGDSGDHSISWCYKCVKAFAMRFPNAKNI